MLHHLRDLSIHDVHEAFSAHSKRAPDLRPRSTWDVCYQKLSPPTFSRTVVADVPGYLVACYCDTYLFGYVFRSLYGKRYHWFPESYFECYGLHWFRDFNHGEPVFLVEGITDAEFLHQYYPYVVSCQTASPSVGLVKLLTNITDDITMIPDPDAGGRRGFNRAKTQFRNHGVNIKKLSMPPNSGDLGEGFNPDDMDRSQRVYLWVDAVIRSTITAKKLREGI